MEKTSLMQHIRTAASKLKGCKLKRQNLLAPALESICRELQLASKEEAMVLVVIFDRQCSPYGQPGTGGRQPGEVWPACFSQRDWLYYLTS